MSLVRLRSAVAALPEHRPRRMTTKFEVYLGDKFVCDGSYRHWKSNELREFRQLSHLLMQQGYEVTSWQEPKSAPPAQEELAS